MAHIRKAAELIGGTWASHKLVQKIFFKLGKREYSAGNALAAIEAAKKAVDAWPLPSNLAELVRYYLSVGRVRKAEKVSKRARSNAEDFFAKTKAIPFF